MSKDVTKGEIPKVSDPNNNGAPQTPPNRAGQYTPPREQPRPSGATTHEPPTYEREPVSEIVAYAIEKLALSQNAELRRLANAAARSDNKPLAEGWRLNVESGEWIRPVEPKQATASDAPASGDMAAGTSHQ